MQERALTAAPGPFRELQAIVSALMSWTCPRMKTLIMKIIPLIFAEGSPKHPRLL
jgi:hypothetical protein